MITKAYVMSAFTAHGQGGNKAGVVLDASQLSEEQKQAIAAELGYSETAFVTASKEATYRVQFFMPSAEVDLCGHATIATWSLMFQRSLIGVGTHSQETLAGKLEVTIAPDGAVFMQQTVPKFLEHVAVAEIKDSLNIGEDDFDPDLQPQIVSTGLRDLHVLVRSKEALLNLKPDFAKMAELSKKYDVLGLHVSALGDGVNCTAIARNFGPLVGIDEESATGTSNGALLCYLKEYGRLTDKDLYVVEQGENMGSLSNILGKFIDGRIWVGGRATLLQEKDLES